MDVLAWLPCIHHFPPGSNEKSAPDRPIAIHDEVPCLVCSPAIMSACFTRSLRSEVDSSVTVALTWVVCREGVKLESFLDVNSERERNERGGMYCAMFPSRERRWCIFGLGIVT